MRYQSLDEHQLERIARNRNSDMRIIYYDGAQEWHTVPDSVLMIPARDSDKETSRYALEELANRGLTIEMLDSQAA